MATTHRATCLDFAPGDRVYHHGLWFYATVVDDPKTPVDRVAIVQDHDSQVWHPRPFWLHLIDRAVDSHDYEAVS